LAVGDRVGAPVGGVVARHNPSAISLALVRAPALHSALLRLHPHGATQSTAQSTEKHVVGAMVGEAVGAVGAPVVIGCSVVVVPGSARVGPGVGTSDGGALDGATVHPCSAGSTPPEHSWQ
jgi:hypothetical protein